MAIMKLNTCALLLLALGCLSVSAAPPMGRVVNGTDASVENYPFVVSVECREIIERKRERIESSFFTDLVARPNWFSLLRWLDHLAAVCDDSGALHRRSHC